MKLVVGLGNPGKKYEGTRHNIGFMVIESLAGRFGDGAGRLKFDGQLFECLVDSTKTLLLMPATYMNLSGNSVRQAVDFYKLDLNDLLLVCDDFQLPLGSLRLRASGSDGGQKGLADTIRKLGSEEFARLRMGIGPVPDAWNPADFVLGKFAENEKQEVDLQVARATDAVQAWISQGITVAMNQFNGTQPTTE